MAGQSTDEQRVLEATGRLLADHPPADTERTEFLAAQYDAGLAWIAFPEGYGGMGLSPRLQRVIQERIETGGGPSGYRSNPIGYGMCGPTLVEWGTEEQKQRWLRDLFAKYVWCQLFSEPGAGSDVAGLSTRAVKDGDEWVLNGQKVWTTLAHISRWGLLIARTDPEQPKHAGLTAFIVDMEAPGVDVRPLRQATGEAEFNEVFFNDVRVPDDWRLGGVGDGWKVAITTLMNERVSIGGNVMPKGSGPSAAMTETWKNLPEARKLGATRDRMLQLWTKAEMMRLNNMRAAEARRVGVPGPEGSLGKLMQAELEPTIWAFTAEMMGMAGQLYESYEMVRPTLMGGQENKNPVTRAMIRGRANSIEGGTTEVMKNIISERVLGLPGEQRADRGPWSKVPRG